MTTFLQACVDGLLIGALYALIGMGLLWLGAVLALVARLPASSMPVAPERMTAHG